MTEPAAIPPRADLTAKILGLRGKLSEVKSLIRHMEARRDLLEDAIARVMKELEALKQAEAAAPGEVGGSQ